LGQKLEVAKHFAKVAGNVAQIGADVSLASVGAYIAVTLPLEASFIEYKILAAVFSVASGHIAYDKWKNMNVRCHEIER
jgi:hypothetical protein